MNHHSGFRKLTALASAEYLSDDECEALRQHLAVCVECRNSDRAFRDLVGCLWLQGNEFDHFVDTLNASPDNASRDRFHDRARREGIQFSPMPLNGRGPRG